MLMSFLAINSNDLLNVIKEWLFVHFKMKNMGDATYILDIEIIENF